MFSFHFSSQIAEFADRLLRISVILSKGLGVAGMLFLITLIFSIPLGFIVALGKMSRRSWIRLPVSLYISIMRGTPLMLQIIFIYFAPSLLLNFNLQRFTAACIAFVINYAAYFAEIFRGGIQSMDPGQYEAAATLGFTKTQTFFRIILPQVIKRVLPSVSNEVITLVKDTSLAQAVGVVEMFSLAKKHTSSQASILPLFVAGVFYYIFNLLVAAIFTRLEKHLNYYH